MLSTQHVVLDDCTLTRTFMWSVFYFAFIIFFFSSFTGHKQRWSQKIKKPHSDQNIWMNCMLLHVNVHLEHEPSSLLFKGAILSFTLLVRGQYTMKTEPWSTAALPRILTPIISAPLSEEYRGMGWDGCHGDHRASWDQDVPPATRSSSLWGPVSQSQKLPFEAL